MILSKYSISYTIGFLKGRLAIRILRDYLRVKRYFTGSQKREAERADAIVRSFTITLWRGVLAGGI